MKTRHDLRCHCGRNTKLAEWGLADDGNPYLHVRVFKQGRVFGEVVVSSGSVKLLCRDCLRWTQVRVTSPAIKSEFNAEAPSEITLAS